MNSEAARWFSRQTSRWIDWPTPQLAMNKRSTRVSVVLPALNEESTVGAIVSKLNLLRDRTGLIDEIVVVDSGSTDRTRDVAHRAGADVYNGHEILPCYGTVPGKGEVLWKSLAVTSGEIVVYIDSDLLDFDDHYVAGLLGPILDDTSIQMVKAFYDRPLLNVSNSGGGRVTELLARPLLAAYFPDLAGVVQPIAGEYAARRTILEDLPFAAGYGVDIGLLIDTYISRGLYALAQVDLGRRAHGHQDTLALGRMAATVLATVLDKHSRGVRASFQSLTQFARDADGQMLPFEYSLPGPSRPPMRDIRSSRRQRGLKDDGLP